MEWKTPKPCCAQFAREGDVAFCPECGQPLVRCMAFAECGGLVGPGDYCRSCVSPQLAIAAGAVVHSKKGERIAIPLVLLNASPSGRPFWVTRLVKREGGSDYPVGMTWERVDAGRERHFTLDTAPLAEGGTHNFGIVMVIASRFKGLEESYAFATDILVTVSGQDAQQINQTINFSGAHFETGGLVNTSLKTNDTRDAGPGGLKDRLPLPFDRQDRYELDHEIRGYRHPPLVVPRNAEFAFTGFAAEDVPPGGLLSQLTGRISCGRSSRVPDPTGAGITNDVALRVYDRKGAVEEPATLAISRHHFDLVVVNDRLCVHARTSQGLEVNGELIASGSVTPLRPGDRLIPIPGRADKMALQFNFAPSTGTAERVHVRRNPVTTA